MIYLDEQYLKTHIFERLLLESTKDNDKFFEEAEKEHITIFKSMLSARYDVEKIFDPNAPISNGLLKRILSKFLIYDAVRRNAARKVPTDYKDEEKWATEMLEKISTGKVVLDDLPKPSDDNGNPIPGTSMWGNLSNKDFYI